MCSNIFRYYHTVKYLKTSQIIARVNRQVKKIFKNREKYSIRRFDSVPRINFIANHLRAGYTKNSYRGGTFFTFLNLTFDTKGSWFPGAADQLWIYNLHYFDYLFDCKELDGTFLIVDWIDNVPVGANNAWHPYTLSLRICNWIWNFERLTHGKSESWQIKVLNSLRNQIEYLTDNIELDVVGNHLIENCKALIVGGSFFLDELLIDKGLRILEKELKEQVLPDGGHYERSPMYHCIVLEDLISIIDCLRGCNRPIPG